MAERAPQVASIVAVATLALTSCTGPTTSDGEPGPRPVSTAPETTAAAVDKIRVPDRLITELRDAGPVPGIDQDLLRLDLRDARNAPALADAPVARALLVTDQEFWTAKQGEPLGPDPVHQVFVVTPDAQWRRIPLDDYGKFHSEPVPTLSPDGRQVAISEGGNRAMVVIDLATGEHRRYPTPTRDPVFVQWSPEGDALKFVSRNKAVSLGFELDLRTGEVSETAYGVVGATYLRSRRTVLEVGADPGGAGVIRRYRDGVRVGAQPLEYPRLLGLSPLARRYLAFGHDSTKRTRAQGDRDGVAVVDPRDGRLVGLLTADGFRRTWTYPATWITPAVLAVVSSHPGTVRVWNVETDTMERLAQFHNRGMHVSLASEQVAALLRKGRR
ncbi:hypothetical protein ACFJIY_16700 [Pimelobacter simplex]|uniref:hypothetical protein n=1 Tax=Nocardioides simplex TaxID=2045 RepID=UPI00366AD2DD